MKIEKTYFWPQWFFLSLSPKERQKINPKILLKLGRANLYLWRALNIYDDFLDQEGEREKLPLANSYYRRFLEIYYRLNLPTNFYRTFNLTLTNLDRANQQEVKKNGLKIKNGKIIQPKNLPNFTNLANLSFKSLALGLGPVALLYQLGETKSKTRISAVLSFWRYILAAKQLSDDARDWFDDLEKGKITAVNVLVLRAAKKRRLILDLKHRPEIIYLLFASEVTEKITIELSNLCQKARQKATKINLNSNCRLITEIIAPLETGLREAAEFRSHWLKNSKIML